MKRIGTVAGLAMLALAGGAIVGGAVAQTPAPRIVLYNEEGLQGAPVTITRDTANLQDIAASEGFDGTANDYAFSIRATGRWQVCMDAGYTTQCRDVEGDVHSLGEQGGSVSSLRYLGPSTAKAGMASPQGAGMRGGPAAAQSPAWQPMYNTDLFGGDYREIAYSTPGNTWQQCKAACDADRQCRAFTYVAPGRTEHGECFLKDTVPEASESECCISGVKGAASSAAAGPQSSGNGVARRIGRSAASKAEQRANQKIDEGIDRAIGRIF